MPTNKRPAAVIFGCAGTILDEAEKRFFAAVNPQGFVLFARNCDSPGQVRGLVASLRATVGRAAPVLIDQEGGRVRRLRPPHWKPRPAMAVFGRLAARDRDLARRAAALNARLIAAELADLGIDVDCVPVLDVPAAGMTDAIGDRALSSDPALVAALGRAICDGMLDGGLLPVIKHLPGHGRATVDSHGALPVVEAERSLLAASDFAPFRALRDMPWGMTGHIVYTAIDPQRPATLSPTVIGEIIRGEIGFDGVLATDDLSMKALSGGFAERARMGLEAGSDLILHCNGAMAEMEAVAAGLRPITEKTEERLARAEAMRRALPPPEDDQAMLDSWLGEVAA